jgi:hypothetical protein
MAGVILAVFFWTNYRQRKHYEALRLRIFPQFVRNILVDSDSEQPPELERASVARSHRNTAIAKGNIQLDSDESDEFVDAFGGSTEGTLLRNQSARRRVDIV